MLYGGHSPAAGERERYADNLEVQGGGFEDHRRQGLAALPREEGFAVMVEEVAQEVLVPRRNRSVVRQETPVQYFEIGVAVEGTAVF